jgi:hypothetical protein
MYDVEERQSEEATITSRMGLVVLGDVIEGI